MGPMIFLRLLGRTFAGFRQDRVPTMGAALAYYALFSVAPLLLAAILAVGLLLGKEAGGRIYSVLQEYMGPRSVAALQSMVYAAQRATSLASPLPAIAGLGTLAVGVLGLFQELQGSLDTIWRVQPAPGEGFWRALGRSVLSFLALGVVALLLLLSFLISAAIPITATLQKLPGSHEIYSAVDFGISFAIITTLFAAVFKLLPGVRLAWRDVFIGGAFTSLFFVIGKQLIALYLGRNGVTSVYGAAGSIVILLLWIYYSSQIFLFGAEFTRVWVTRDGRGLQPKPGARIAAPGA